MQRILQSLGLIVLSIIFSTQVWAFDSGSDGSYGAIDTGTGTLTLDIPPGGVFQVTTVNIPEGGTLRFNKNKNNDPVIIKASGDVTINGTIDISGGEAQCIATGGAVTGGQGGPGGFDGGESGSSFIVKHGNGRGPGGGCNTGTGEKTHAGGNYATQGWDNQNTTLYGNFRIQPLIGGSGGAGSYGVWNDSTATRCSGGGGGGALAILSSGTITLNGLIDADGGNGPHWNYIKEEIRSGAGAGGAVRLVATTITGNGTIDADGGRAWWYGDNPDSSYTYSRGGEGRIRIEANFNKFAGTMLGMPTSGAPLELVGTAPTLTFVSISGVPCPATTTGDINTVDLILPATATNPIQVKVATSGIPVGSTVTIQVAPRIETNFSLSQGVTISGTEDAGTATIPVNIPDDMDCVLRAMVTMSGVWKSGSAPARVGKLYTGEQVKDIQIGFASDGSKDYHAVLEDGQVRKIDHPTFAYLYDLLKNRN